MAQSNKAIVHCVKAAHLTQSQVTAEWAELEALVSTLGALCVIKRWHAIWQSVLHINPLQPRRNDSTEALVMSLWPAFQTCLQHKSYFHSPIFL